jgi:hypothetical protein
MLSKVVYICSKLFYTEKAQDIPIKEWDKVGKTKESVREHVISICAKRRAAVQKEIDELYGTRLKPLVKTRINEIAGRAPEWATYVYDRLDQYRDDIDTLLKIDPESRVYGGTYRQNRMTGANELVYLESNLLKQCWGNMLIFVEKPEQGHFDFGSAPINEMIAELQKDVELRELLGRRDDINKLLNQLTDLIDKTAGSGKQAYDRLVLLGVDMSDYEEPVKNLPAIIKLEADVCLLNGNC